MDIVCKQIRTLGGGGGVWGGSNTPLCLYFFFHFACLLVREVSNVCEYPYPVSEKLTSNFFRKKNKEWTYTGFKLSWYRGFSRIIWMTVFWHVCTQISVIWIAQSKWWSGGVFQWRISQILQRNHRMNALTSKLWFGRWSYMYVYDLLTASANEPHIL